MGKTRAEYQREYRERRKQRDGTFLVKERERVRKYKLSIDAMSEKEKIAVREKNRMYKRISRDKKKKQNAQKTISNDIQSQDNANSNLENGERFTPPLKVKLNFAPRVRNARRSKALRVANSEIKKLRQEVTNLTRMNAKFRKRNQRLLKSNRNAHHQQKINNVPETSSPKTKTEIEIREMGLSPRKVPKKIRKKLVMANAMFSEINRSKKANKSQKKRRVIANIVSGKVIQKYRCVEAMSRESSLSRRILKKAKSKLTSAFTKRRKVFARQKVKKRVIEFFERDDVSVMMPGKHDCKKTMKGQNQEKIQTRVLTDYLSNLFEKFVSENPDLKISKSVFCRLRPSHILLTKLISRNTCLCSKHQNFAMKLKALRLLGIELSPNPETVSKTVSVDEMKRLLSDGLKDQEHVVFEEWRRTDVDGKKK